jgi:predicted transcriptional regulator
MSTTTTIRLPDELKKRVARAAKRAGTTPHAFILDAIAERTVAQEQRADFVATAEMRFARIAESGDAIKWRELRGYLEKRATGRRTRRPAIRTSARHKS